MGNDVKLQRGDAEASASSAAVHRRAVLEKAKARAAASAPPPALTGTPNFGDVRDADRGMRPAPGASAPPPATLSKTTQRDLEALARANASEAGAVPDEDAEAVLALDREALAELLRCDARTADRVHELLYPEQDVGAAAKMRRAVEARLQPMDIGEFLSNGVISQAVPIIEVSENVKTGLRIVYQTVPDGVEKHVDRMLSDEAALIRSVRAGDKTVDGEMSQREYVRRQNEYALAVHVRSYMGTEWPALVKASGDVDEKAVETRMSKVRQIHGQVLELALRNLGWFLERVQTSLDAGVLGNG